MFYDVSVSDKIITILTAGAVMVAAYAVARLVEMPLKALESRKARAVATAAVAGVAVLVIGLCAVWVLATFAAWE